MKIRSIPAALFVCFTASTFCVDSLVSAIDNNDVKEVRKLVKQQSPLTKEQKKLLLKEISDTVKMYKDKTKSLFSSGADMVRFVGGLFLLLNVGLPMTVVGSVMFLLELGDELSLTLLGLVLAAGGGGLSYVGCQQTHRGWTMYSAQRALKKACKIESCVQEAPEK